MKAALRFPGRLILLRGRDVVGRIAGLALACSLFADPIRISPSVGSFSSRLPVMVIDTAGSGPLMKDGIDRAAELNLFVPVGGTTGLAGRLPALASALTISVRGTSSAEFPKKSFNVTLRNRQGAKLAQPLLDLPAAEKWALVAPWKYDPTYVNNAFVYALSNRLGRWAPRTRFIEVFLNTHGGEVTAQDYAGIYVLTERIEPGADRVNIPSLKSSDTTLPALGGGYIFQIDQAAADDVAWHTARGVPAGGEAELVLVAPRAADVKPAQLEYLRTYVQRMEHALYADGDGNWAQRTSLDFMDRAAWVDHHLINLFVCNPDALVRSAYFTKDRGGKLLAGPVWDFDRALGCYWDERGFRWDVWSGVGVADVWRTGWWGVLVQDPEFMQQWIDRWQSLRTTELATPRLVQLARDLAAQIGSEAAARDVGRWPDNASPGGSHAAEIERLAGWLELRARWIDEQWVAPPAVQSSGGALVFTAVAGTELVYTLDGSDPRALGGDMAPNALFAAGALTVAGTANVHVRSYRADRRGVFPGSPWSSVVGGERSSPLTPAARIINLSALGRMGAGAENMIVGVVVADTAAKRYLARAIGPGLAAFGVLGAVPDPQLSVIAADGADLERNEGWQTGPGATELPELAKAAGAFALLEGSADAALAGEFGAGAQALRASPAGGVSGLGMVELYELEANGRLANLSIRAMIGPGDGPLIGGIVIQGTAFKRLLIRAVGPSLAKLGMTGVPLDPVLTVYAGADRVAGNDRWGAAADDGAIAAATRRVGAFPLDADSEDAAMLVTLPPGAYTLEVNARAGTGGAVLLEIYEVP